MEPDSDTQQGDIAAGVAAAGMVAAPVVAGIVAVATVLAGDTPGGSYCFVLIVVTLLTFHFSLVG